MSLPEHKVVKDSPRSLINWVDKFDMTCAPKNKFGYFGSLYFAGLVLGSLILPRLSDKLGRKKLSALGGMLHVLSSLVILSTSSIQLAFAMIFVSGFAFAGRVFVGYVWMTEHMRVQDVPKATAAMFAIDSLCIMNAAIYFQYISKDWTYFFAVPVFGMLLTTLYLIFFVSESPKFLHSIGERERAREILEGIAKSNGMKKRVIFYDEGTALKGGEEQMAGLEAPDDNQVESTGETGAGAAIESRVQFEKQDLSVRTFLKSKQNLTNGLIFMFLAITCSFCYYLINFYVKYIPGNIFTNQIANSIAESIAHGASCIVVTVLSIKKGFISAFSACNLSSFLLLFATLYDVAWLIPVTVLGAKAGIAVAFAFLYFSTVSYFRSEYLGLIMGLMNVVGRLSTIAAPMIAEQDEPVPMLSAIILCSLATLGCFWLD